MTSFLRNNFRFSGSRVATAVIVTIFTVVALASGPGNAAFALKTWNISLPMVVLLFLALLGLSTYNPEAKTRQAQ